MNHELKNTYQLSDLLLERKDTVGSKKAPTANNYPAAATLTELELQSEIRDIMRKLKPYISPELTGYKSFRQKTEVLPEERLDKVNLFVEHKVYDKYLKATLREFLIIGIAFLRRIYIKHAAHVLYGNVTPQSFIYDRSTHKIYRQDLDLEFSEKGTVRTEQHANAELIYVKTNVRSLLNNQYLAPELSESLLVYEAKHRLHDLVLEADHRNFTIENRIDVDRALRDFHQTTAKYSNKAEVFSVGYVLMEILSHLLVKLIDLNHTTYEDIDNAEITNELLQKAEQMLPEQFANPGDLRLVKFLNETVAALYAILDPNPEKRAEIMQILEKFISILRRLDEEPLTAVHDTSESMLDRLRAKRRK